MALIRVREAIMSEETLTSQEYAVRLLNRLDQLIFQIKKLDLKDLVGIDDDIEDSAGDLVALAAKIKFNKRASHE